MRFARAGGVAGAWLIVVASCRSRTSATTRSQAARPAATESPAANPSGADAALASAHGTDASATATADAGPPLIDLLHATHAEVSVSSVVQNQTDRPQNLVDGLLDTTWSSRTDDQVGVEIAFRVPDDASVEEIAMTVGMTRASDGGDVFTMNPRISSVMVFREYDLVGTFPLDVARRDLQAIPVHRRGGLYRIVVHAVTAGTERNWREVSVSELEVRGRVATPTPNVPTVRVERMIPATLPTRPYMIPASGIIAPGCFAWSQRQHTAACIRGDIGTHSDQDPTRWDAVFPGSDAGDEASQIDLLDHRDADMPVLPSEAPLTSTAARAVRSALASGSFVDLEPLEIALAPGIPAELRSGIGVRWMRRRTFAGGDNAAERFTDRLEVRWSAREAWTAVETFTDEPVFEPDFRAYFIPGDRYLVLSAVRHHGDEGITATHAYAWQCEATTRACE